MAIAHDATSFSTAVTTALSHTHTPTGTPRGVVVMVCQGGSGDDLVTGVTYGGVAMTRAGAPALLTSGETGASYIYFLGSGIPTGAQTVAVSIGAGTFTRQAVCATMTASNNTEVDAYGTVVNANITNPSITLATTAATTTSIYGVDWSGDSPASTIVPAGETEITETGVLAGTFSFIRRDALGGGGNIAVSWTYNSDEAAAAAIAVREATAATHERSVALGASASLAVSGTFWSILERSVALTGTPVLSTVGQRDVQRSVSIAGTPVLAVSGTFWSILERQAALAGSATLTVAGQRVVQRSVSLTGNAAITITTPLTTIGRLEGATAVVGIIE